MKETPKRFGGNPEKTAEPIADLILEQLLVVKEVILDAAPEGWEEEIDPVLLQEHRKEIMTWTDKEIIIFCQNNYVWSDPTYAKALLDVISGKVTSPLT